MRKVSTMDGQTRADERMGYIAEDALRRAMAAAGDGANTIGSGTSYPYPYFGPADVTYWRADNSATASITDQNGNTHTNEDYNKGTGEDNVDGASVISWWVIPNNTVRLTIHGYYVKRNGTYGRKERWQFDDITDDEASGNFCERTLTGLRPGKVFDIVGCRATLSDGSKAPNPVEPDKPSTIPPSTVPAVSLTDSLLAWPNPLDTPTTDVACGYGPYSTYPTYSPALASPYTAALARIDLRNYALLTPRITDVRPAEKEREGIVYPVRCTYAADLVDSITLFGFRVGRKASGAIDYAKYGKRLKKWKHPLTEAERAAGTCDIPVGPFNDHQARQIWHIVRIKAVNFFDVLQSKRYKEFYPAEQSDCAGPDDIDSGWQATHSTSLQSGYQTGATNSASPLPGRQTTLGAVDDDDIPAAEQSDFQNAGAATSTAARRVLAVLQPEHQVDGHLDGFTVTTYPDLVTEKDNDAVIEFAATIKTGTTAGAGTTVTAGDAYADEAVFIFMRKADYDAHGDDRTYYIRKRCELNPEDTTAKLSFHRKIGRRFRCIKIRLKNAFSHVDIDVHTQTGGGLTAGVFAAGNGTGGGAYVDDDAITGITSIDTLLATGDTAGTESVKAHFYCSIVNAGVGGLPVVPKRLLVYVSKKGATSDPGALPASTDFPTSGNWRLEKVISLRNDHALVSVATVKHGFSLKLRRKKTHWIKCRLYVAGDSDYIDETTSYQYDADSEIPGTNYAHGNQNMIVGGAMIFSRSDYDLAAAGGSYDNDYIPGKQWRTTPSRRLANNFIVATDHPASLSSDPEWNRSGHYLICYPSTTTTFYVLLKRALTPGERISLSIVAAEGTEVGASSATVTFDVIKATNVTSGTPAQSSIVDAADTKTLTNAIPSTFREFGFQVDIQSSLSFARGTDPELVWAKFTIVTGVQSLRVTNFMLVHGDQIMTYDYAPADAIETTEGNSGTITQSYSGAGASTIDGSRGGRNPEYDPSTGRYLD